MMQYCAVKSASEIADRGAVVTPDALVTALDELAAGPRSNERYQAQRMITHALVASAREALDRGDQGARADGRRFARGMED